MTYYKDKVSLLSDSYDNVDLFRLMDKEIIRYHFNKRTKRNIQLTIAMDANKEYDVYIDEKNTIYLAYQNLNNDILLAIIRGDKINRIKLTEGSTKEVYYLQVIGNNEEPHIFYFKPEDETVKKYKLYHHHLNDKDWIVDVVDEIEIRELLNPLSVFKTKEEIIAAYYDNNLQGEQIYIRPFNFKDGKWGEKIKLTDSENYKLYLDLICINNKLHLTYCQYEGGILVVKYEMFNYEDGHISKQKEEEISNLGSQQDPTLIYFDNRLWVSWIEYEKVYSRYSDDGGNTWSPIYLWKESINKSIVRYKYSCWEDKDDGVFNYSFGKIKGDIKFIGFGPLENIEEVPLKKKISMKFSKDLPTIRI